MITEVVMLKITGTVSDPYLKLQFHRHLVKTAPIGADERM